jgi:hypothetical protein
VLVLKLGEVMLEVTPWDRRAELFNDSTYSCADGSMVGMIEGGRCEFDIVERVGCGVDFGLWCDSERPEQGEEVEPVERNPDELVHLLRH